jgi:hypothetical protein
MKSTSEGRIQGVVQEKKDERRSIRSKIFRRAHMEALSTEMLEVN